MNKARSYWFLIRRMFLTSFPPTTPPPAPLILRPAGQDFLGFLSLWSLGNSFWSDHRCQWVGEGWIQPGLRTLALETQEVGRHCFMVFERHAQVDNYLCRINLVQQPAPQGKIFQLSRTAWGGYPMHDESLDCTLTCGSLGGWSWSSDLMETRELVLG